MSIDHKAFLFDYDEFDGELREILEESLATGKSSLLVSFVEANLAQLKDPNEGEMLDSDWQSSLEFHDAHEYGDFALTKYYDPKKDIGLGHAWEEAQEYLERVTGSGMHVLGETIGPRENLFDPGKQGAYFQSCNEAEENLARISSWSSRKEAPQELRDWQGVLERAVLERKGLYITF